MREILFRGKRTDTGEWVEGYYIPVEKCPAIFDCDDPDNRAWWDYGEARLWGCYEVDPSTVGQFTGLTDKNGKKVFEHDIIQFRFEGDAEPPSTPPVWYETGHVFWHEQLLGWYVAFADDLDGIPIQEYDDHEDIFVVGNSFDNPELLEEVHE